MTKVPSKPKSGAKKTRATPSPPFKQDIRLANAVIGAIAFLQKANLQATPKIIKKYMLERSREKKESKNMEQLPGYLNRGVELGILKKANGSFRIGELEMARRKRKKNKREKTSTVVTEAPKYETMQDMEPAENAS